MTYNNMETTIQIATKITIKQGGKALPSAAGAFINEGTKAGAFTFGTKGFA